MLNDHYGLPILIFTNPSDGQRFVLLSGNGLDVAQFLHYGKNYGKFKCRSKWTLSQDKVLKSMDIQYDCDCAQALLSADKF